MIKNIPITFYLIGISLSFTLIRELYPAINIFGLNDIFIEQGNYLNYLLQLFISNFLHGGLIHFLMNSIFLFLFGYPLELLIGKKKYIIFFIFVVFFNGILITFFSGNSTNTIGISGFCMAIMAYYTLELKARNNPEYKGGITALAINVGIGFVPGISLLGHLFGVIAGIIYYYLNKDFFKEKFVGEAI